MAQYDVYPNPSTTAGQGIPYVVIIRSDLLDNLSTRLTSPLATLSYSGKVPSALCPLVTGKGQRLHALAHFAAPLPAKLLRKPVGSVSAQASALVLYPLVPIGQALALERESQYEVFGHAGGRQLKAMFPRTLTSVWQVRRSGVCIRHSSWRR